MSDFIQKRKDRLETFKKTVRKKTMTHAPLDIPDGLFIKCDQCGHALYEKQLMANHHVCPFCDFHFRIQAKSRMDLILDQGSFHPLFDDLTSMNPLDMPEYEAKLAIGKTLSGLNDACLCGVGELVGIRVAIAVLEADFMMGSMGSVLGEAITRLIEYADQHRLPLIIFSASGGARMQEGIFSLMQMAKTSGALYRFDRNKGLFISVMTHPTTGGVAASFASLGDITIAEKSALIGFAGARVIKQTIQQELPVGFQTDLFQLRHGQVDKVVHRKDMRRTLFRLLSFHQGGKHV